MQPSFLTSTSTTRVRPHAEATRQELRSSPLAPAHQASQPDRPVITTTTDGSSGQLTPCTTDEAVRIVTQTEVTTDQVRLADCRERPQGAVAAAAADELLQTWNTGGRSDPSHVSNRIGYHPGTRLRVDVSASATSKKSQSTASRIQAALRNRGYWPLRNCYEDLAREQKDPGGKTWLRATVGANGSFLSTRVLRTELLHRDIAQCQQRALRGLRVEPLGRKRLDVEVQVAVWPGDVPLLPLPNCVDRDASFDARKLTALVETLQSRVAECMQSARSRDPNLWGRLALSFVVGQNGRPSEIQESQSQFGDVATITCVSELLQSLELPRLSAPDRRLVAAWRLHRPSADPLPQPATHQPNQAKLDSSARTLSPELSPTRE